jgi:elongation factor P
MINATDLKGGVTFLKDGAPYKVIQYALIKMGRGGATVKITARNLETGAVEPISYSSNVKVDEVNTSKRKLQFLFKDSDTATFMNPTTFEQVEIPLSVVSDQIIYIKEGDNVDVFFWEERPLSFELQPKIVLKVTETDPGVKGNSASNIYKSATLENGLVVKVPLFIQQGELVKVDTRTGAYVERAKD